MALIKSHIVYVGDRRVHYRRSGAGPAVVLLHLSPSWARALDSYTSAFAETGTAIAFDTPGYGLSDPLDIDQPTIGDFADALRDTLDAIGISQCALFGSHTGATIAIEFALRYPERCSVAVFDGYPGFTAAQRADYLAHHFDPYVPRADGSHLLETWHKFRSVFLFSPPYAVGKDNRADRVPPSPARTQDGVLPRLMAGARYTHAYRAVFQYDGLSRVGELKVPTCFAARHGDSLMQSLDHLSALPATCWIERLPSAEGAAAERYTEILNRHPAQDAPPRQGSSAPVSDGTALRYLDIDGKQVAVRRNGRGEGIPLIVIPHLPGGADAWESLLPKFAGSRVVYAVDLPDNGDSDNSTSPPSVEAYARDLGAILTALEADRVALLGHGGGASVATSFAVEHPDRVDRLILSGPMCLSDQERQAIGPQYADPIEPSADGTHLIKLWFSLRNQQLFWPWYDERMETIRHAEPQVDPGRLTEQATAILKHYDRFAAIYEALFAYPLPNALRSVTAPTLVCSAPSDVFHEFSENAAAQVPGAKIAILDEGADALASAVNSFLA